MKQLLLLALLFFAANLKSQESQSDLNSQFNQTIEKYVEGVSPGMAVGVVRNGKIIYERFLGYANLEHIIEIDKKTRFNIASNAKQFTALCILKLIGDGTLNLDDDIRKFIPDLYPDIQTKIRISHLLTHTSGVRDVYDLWALKGQTSWKLFVDNGDALKLIKAQKDLNFEPGTEYLYSNSNYILLTEIIEKVTQQKFNEFAKLLFTDLDMPETDFQENYMKVIPHKARPYGNWNGWREYPSITEIHGDGGLFTTLEDQLKWEQIIQLNEGKHISKKLLDDSQSLPDTSLTKNYGFGVMFGNYEGLDYSYHDGSTGAYNATFLRFHDEKLAIVVMSNNGNVPTNYLAKQLADISLNLEKTTVSYPAGPRKTEKLKDQKHLIGDYQNEDGTIISIMKKTRFSTGVFTAMTLLN